MLGSPHFSTASRNAMSSTTEKLILTQSIMEYSRPGMASQWQPEFVRMRASSMDTPSLRTRPRTSVSMPTKRGFPFLSANWYSTDLRSRLRSRPLPTQTPTLEGSLSRCTASSTR